jgi:hypothetical protein
MENPTSRQFLPTFAELLDRMTVTQIKLSLIENGKEDFKDELRKISHDLNNIIEAKSISLNSDLILIFINLAQLNLHIWNNKDKMQENLDNQETYLQLLKISHQLNGFRNQLKNKLLAVEGITDKSQLRSNFETDGLRWNE